MLVLARFFFSNICTCTAVVVVSLLGKLDVKLIAPLCVANTVRWVLFGWLVGWFGFRVHRNLRRVLREENDPKWESGKIKPDDGMRDLGELFEEAPSVESYPEYHLKVKNIMDLNTIREKV